MRLDVGLDHLLCWCHGSGNRGYCALAVVNIHWKSRMWDLFFSPDPVVPYRGIYALPHSLHVPSTSRQAVACYRPQRAPRCCAGSAGPALPHKPRLFYETCSQGSGRQWEEAKVNPTPGADCRGILQAVTRRMFSGDFLWRTNCIKHTILQLENPEEVLKNIAVRLNCLKSVTFTQHSPHGLLDPDKKPVNRVEDCDQITQLSGDSCR